MLFISDEENSSVQGIVTDEGLFDGTIFSKNEIYYVEPIARYRPSSNQHQYGSSWPQHARGVHTIIYKTSDVEVPPSFRNHPCASQSLHLPERKKRSALFGGDHGDAKKKTVRKENNIFSSLPSINSHDDIIESNILKTYINVPDINRTRKKVNATNVFRFPKFPNEVFTQTNVINRPKIHQRNVTLSQRTGDADGEEFLPNGTLKHVNKRATVDPKKTTCMLYLQADHLFYQKYGTEEACIEVMTRHVQRVNSIYRSTGKVDYGLD